jgi:hypothetical protein
MPVNHYLKRKKFSFTSHTPLPRLVRSRSDPYLGQHEWQDEELSLANKSFE